MAEGTAKLLWQPSEERVRASLLHHFAREAESESGLSLPDYDSIWSWSIEHPEQFWDLLWRFAGVIGERGDGPALDRGASLIDARFFPNARINFAENLLRESGEGPAIIFHAESGARREISWGELHDSVSRTAQALRAFGVEEGDRVAGFVPNMPEAIVAMLATASLGAVWSSCSPDFGVSGVLDRFGQIEPKVLFTADGYSYNGRDIPSLSTVAGLLERLPSIERVIVVPLLEARPQLDALGGKAVLYPDLLAAQEGGGIDYRRVDFNAPLLIMFSSGTTGAPKCIVHRAGGVLLKHLKEHRLQSDIKPGDRVFFFTTCGWMMWNWLVSGLASRATVVLFDGSPLHPGPERLADLAEQEGVTHFGTSAKYLDACAKEGLAPSRTHSLPALRAVLTTGSPLSPDGFEYVYRDWKEDVCLASISGGTDIVGCFVGGNPLGPVWRGECQKRHLGMDVHAYDERGQSVVGEPGELVCRSPHPSMPRGFWNDPDGSRYRAAYFEAYDGVWHHGDLVEVTANGGVIFLGRSDATLNPGGVRIGTAEIYRQVERLPEVLESVAVGQDWDGDVRVVLFVRLREGAVLDDDLVAGIKREIRANTTPRHVPAKVLQVADIPRTKSGKIVELAVREVIHGRPVRNVHALANAGSLEEFRDRAELDAE